MPISPKLAADLAAAVYGVQSEFELMGFLSQSVFSSSVRDKQSFKARVGGRIICPKDGFCVAACGGAGYEKDLFLMFRGSTTSNFGADWISNARCGVESSPGGLVHVGFSQIFKSMRQEVGEFVTQQIRDRKNPVHTIHCIGHSLGGAVATLAADWMKLTTHKNVELHTFGAPKPGFEGFAKSVSTRLSPENVHRVFHTADPVPMVPLYPFTHPPLPGYGYVRGPYNALVSANAHKMTSYIASVKGAATWRSMNRPPPVTGYDRVIEKWLESEGSLNPFSADTWGWINAGLEYVLKKILGNTAIQVQAGFIGGLSLADKIAWFLLKGIDVTTDIGKKNIELAFDAGKWVLHLMRKMMQALHMKAVETKEELTRALMRLVLDRIMDKISRDAIHALNYLAGGR